MKNLRNQIQYILNRHYDFLFRFLEINFKRGILYYNLYRNIKANANSLIKIKVKTNV